MAALSPSPAAEPTTLRQAAGDRFLVGAAVRPDQLARPESAKLIAEQFNCLTAENVFKPQSIQPRKGEFNFADADKIADFAAKHNMALIGHTLCWHNQTGRWMFEDAQGKPLPREEGLANLKAHIFAVAGHFKGKVKGWDVVNEAIDDGGPYLRDTPARKSIGDDYIIQAFKFAHEADPNAELYYNDYNIERDYKNAKTVRLLNELKAAGVRIDGVGVQAHWGIAWPDNAELERGLKALAATGLKLHFTELDVDVLPRKGESANITDVQKSAGSTAENPYVKGLPDEMQKKLADRYAELFRLIMKHGSQVERITFWGVDDGSSWLNGFPIRGRTNYPLLFDRQFKPKPAAAAVMKVLREEGK